MTDPIPLPDLNVVVSCTLTIDGREYTARRAYSPSSWRLMKDDPPYRQAIEADIRRALGELVTRELAPPVRVHEPTTEALRVEPCKPPRMAVRCGGECIVIADSDSDYDRTDRVVLTGDTLIVCKGVPGGSPRATPVGAHYIADVYVPRGTTSISAANITSSGLLFHRPTTEAP